MDLRLLIKILGAVAIALGFLLWIPAAYGVFEAYPFSDVFFYTGSGCVLVGGFLWLSTGSHEGILNNRTAFAVVTGSWLLAAVVGAIPYYLSGALPTMVDALFESMSGFTTTGASVFTEVESVAKPILLWRSMTQFFGGMGIILFFIGILPLIGVGSVQLFRAEMTGPKKDRISPRVADTARKLWTLYIVFTAILGVALWLSGMSVFDALNHAFCIAATGGFSTRNQGAASFNSPVIDVVMSVGMLIFAMNFTLHYRFFVRREVRVLRDTELRWFLSILLLATAIFAMALLQTGFETPLSALRKSFFMTTAAASTTGITGPDFVVWPPIAHVVIIMLMVMGGMSGSTGGGVKCIRLVAAFKQLNKELMLLIHPKAVLVIKANDQPIPEHVVNTIWAFIFMYFLVFSMGALILTGTGINIIEASSAVFSALSNHGPALGSLGPLGNYSALPDLAKNTLSLCMLIGRLEFFTVLVLLTPAFWRE